MSRSETIQRYIKKIQPDIVGCYACQPYENGEPVWIFGRREDLESILDDFGVPDDLRDEVISGLRCGNCGCELERFQDVGRETKEERELENKFIQWEFEYEKRFEDFSKHLETYPYLGVAHPIGREILSEIEKFPKTKLKEEIWYRARKVEGGRKFSNDDMFAPDPGIVQIPEGRYNHFGQSHLYLSNTPYAAGLEAVVSSQEVLVWIQDYKILGLNDVLDVRIWQLDKILGTPIIAVGLIYSGALSKDVERTQGWKPEYFVPRYIADTAKYAGFNAIIFDSRRPHHSNLVIFDYSRLKYEFSGDPYIFDLKSI